MQDQGYNDSRYSDPTGSSDELDAIAELVSDIRELLIHAIDRRGITVTPEALSAIVGIDECLCDIFHDSWESNWKGILLADHRAVEEAEINQERGFPKMFPRDMTVEGWKAMMLKRLSGAMKRRAVSTNPNTYKDKGEAL